MRYYKCFCCGQAVSESVALFSAKGIFCCPDCRSYAEKEAAYSKPTAEVVTGTQTEGVEKTSVKKTGKKKTKISE